MPATLVGGQHEHLGRTARVRADRVGGRDDHAARDLLPGDGAQQQTDVETGLRLRDVAVERLDPGDHHARQTGADDVDLGLHGQHATRHPTGHDRAATGVARDINLPAEAVGHSLDEAQAEDAILDAIEIAEQLQDSDLIHPDNIVLDLDDFDERLNSLGKDLRDDEDP